MTFNPIAKNDLYKINNGEAAQLMMRANDDYLLARTGLINGLFSGLWVGANAAEKYIKSVIMYKSKISLLDLRKELKRVALSNNIMRDKEHRIDVCVYLAKEYDIVLNGFSHDEINLLCKMYSGRYPDNPDQLNHGSSRWFEIIDKFVFCVWDNMKEFSPELYYITGPHLYHYSVWGDEYFEQTGPSFSYHRMYMMENQNLPLIQRLPDVKGGCAAILNAWHPKSSK